MSFLNFFPQNRARLSVFKSCSGRYPSPQWFFYMVSGTHLLPPGGYKLLLLLSWHFKASLIAQLVKNPPAMQETWVRSLGWEDPLEKGKATHSSVLAWRIPWTTQSMGLQRIRHDWASVSQSWHPCLQSWCLLVFLTNKCLFSHISRRIGHFCLFKTSSGRYPSPQWFFYIPGTHLLPPGGYKLLLLTF